MVFASLSVLCQANQAELPHHRNCDTLGMVAVAGIWLVQVGQQSVYKDGTDFFFPLPTLTHKWHSPSEENGQDNNITIDYNEHQSNLVVLLCCIILVSAPVWLCAWSRILVQVTIYRRFLISRDDHLDQSETYDIS